MIFTAFFLIDYGTNSMLSHLLSGAPQGHPGYQALYLFIPKLLCFFLSMCLWFWVKAEYEAWQRLPSLTQSERSSSPWLRTIGVAAWLTALSCLLLIPLFAVL